MVLQSNGDGVTELSELADILTVVLQWCYSGVAVVLQ
jgi:hypothetical protein